MLQSLISHDDESIDALMEAVTAYCASKGLLVDSDEGRRAITLAIDRINNHGPGDLLDVISVHLSSIH